MKKQKSFYQITAPLVELVASKVSSLNRPNLTDFVRKMISDEIATIETVYDELEAAFEGKMEQDILLWNRLALKELEIEMLKAEMCQMINTSVQVESTLNIYFKRYLKETGSLLAKQTRDYHLQQSLKTQLTTS